MEELFEFDGQEYTLTEVQEAAKAKSLNIDDYINQYNISRKPGKTTPPKEDNQGAPAEVNAAPQIGMLDLDSNLVNTLLESPNKETEKQFLNSVESFHKKELDERLNSLLKQYDAGFLTSENKINPGLNAVDSPVYKKRLNKINKEYNNFYNDIAQKEYKALLNNKTKEFETFDPTSGLTISQNFALGVAKTFESLFDITEEGVSKGPLLNAKDAFTAAKKLDLYSSAERNIEARKQRIIQQGKDEGWSDKVLQQQLNFFTDPTNSSGKKIANNEKEYKDFLKINKNKESLEMASKLLKSDQQFLQQAKEYGQSPEFLDENGNINLTKNKVSRAIGEQATQLIFAAVTAPIAPGRSTYMQEIGPMMTEALEVAAIKEFGKEAVAEMSGSDKREKYITLIEEGKLDLSKLETSAIFSGLLDTAGAVFQGIKIAKAGAPLLRNIFKRKFKESLKIAISKGADISQATAGETLTEIAQEGLNVMGVAEASGTKQNWAGKRFGEVGLQTLITTPFLVGGGRGVKSTATQLKRSIQGAYDPNSLRAEINNQIKIVNMLEKNKSIDSEQAANEIDNLYAAEDVISNSIYNKFEPEAKAEMIDILAKEKGIKRKIDKLKSTYDADSVFSAGQIKALEEQLNEIENDKQAVIPTQNYLVSQKKLLKHINNNSEKYNNYKAFSFDTNNELIDFVKRNNISEKIITNITAEKGFSFGAEIPDQKLILFSKENIKKAKGIDRVVGGNVIHHELGHVIMSSLPDSDINNFIKNIRVEVEKLPEGSKLKEAFQLAKARVKTSYSDQSNRVKSEEILTSMSDFLRALDEDILVDDASFLSKTFSFLAEKLNLATGEQIDFSGLAEPQQALQFFQKYNKSLGNSKNLFQRIKKVSTTSARPEVADEIEKFSKSISGDNIQKIFEEKGKDGAFEIIEAYKPLTTKLTNKYRDVPGFDFELLQSEIEIGKRGLLDLINAYDPSKGATLNTYIQGQLANRSIEAANRILDTEFKLDVTEAKGVTDTATAEETIEASEQVEIADEIKSLRKEIGLSEELVNTVKDAVVKTFGTKLPNPQDPKFRLELQKRFRTELKKPIAKFVGKQADYESFLRDNFQSIYNKLPQSLINRRFKDFQEPVLDKNGKHVREKTAEGNKVYTKKKISKAEFIKYFLGSDVGRSTQGTRKTAIVEAVAEEIAFDATMEVLNDPVVIKKYKDIAEITGENLPENFMSEISKQIDRGENFKFSKSLLEEAKKEYNLSNQEIAKLAMQNDSNFLKNNYPILYKLFNDASERQIKNASDAVEKENLEIFNRAEAIISDSNILNVVDNQIAGDDGSRVDHHLIINNKKTGIETKKDYTARYGQLELKFEIIKNDVVLKSTLNSGEDFINIATLLNSYKPFKKALLDYAKKANIEKSRDKISFELKEKLKNEKFQRKVSFKAKVNIDAIKLHYINKEKNGFRGDYILIGEDIYHFGLNPLDLNVPELKGNGQIEVRLKLSKDKEGNVAVRLIGEYRVPNVEKTNTRSIKNDKDFIDLIKESKTKFSKSLNKEFNTILEQSSGIKATKKFSPVEARIAGKGKGKLKLFIPYSADDFVGLLYTTLSGGKAGDQQMDWYRENLLRPFSRGIQQYEAAKQNALREWQILKKEAKKNVPGGLNKKNASGLTNQEAVRLYIWKQQGMEIPGTKGSAAFVNENLKAVRKNPELKAFAERLMALNPEGYPAPSENWDSGDITTDLVSYIDGVKRGEFLTEFKDNAAKIFSDSNKEKLRALYGDNFIEALDDMLHRMKTGTNRRFGASKIEKQFMDWTNNSVGAIMFFNARSAVLQTLSAVNFINFTDNNPINAAIAFGNFPQYVKDFSTLFNSNFLKQRRTGLQTDVNADEIARAAKGAKNTARAMLSAILKFGFTPTQIADSFAIASGGATFYRNRINKYKKEGLSQQEAETKAFTDFQEIAEETQQSARPDRISLQQASSLGRIILAFGNTPMQYARLTKKASLDLINGRGDWKTNISKIMYYSVIQNIIFSALQQGLFALLFDDEDDDKEKSRLFRIGNSSLDTFLRGSGVYGAAAATAKNMILKVIEESKKSRSDYTKVAIESTALSPPINSKLRKLVSAGKTFTYKQSKEKVFTEGFSLENPAFLAGGQIVSALTNLPADRVVLKADHLKTAIEPETELWQSIALSLGWSEWDLNMIQNQTKKESNLKIKPFKTKGLKIKKFKK